MSLDLARPLPELPAFPLDERQQKALRTLGCVTIGDLLLHLPRRYEDRQHFEAFPNQPLDRAVCLCGVVTDARKRFAGRRSFFEITVESTDPGPLDGPLVCRWFQMPWLHRVIAADQVLVLYGKPKISGRRLVIDHPDYEIVEQAGAATSIHLGRITPVYPLTSGISQRQMRELAYHVHQQIEPGGLPDLLPQSSASPPRWQTLQQVHFPRSMEEIEPARRALALEEFVQLQLAVLTRRRHYRVRTGAPHCGPGALLERFFAGLPFEPTAAQQRAVDEIRKDLADARPMNRLLQGDVGSGKTLVAIAAMLLAVEAGFQTVLMAPTQILAEQHYLLMRRWLKPHGIRVGLRTADRHEDGFLPLLEGGDEAQILIGTHALLHDRVQTADPGLIVIDEQHKFGVLQRGRLMDRATLPDVLVMTATPIPRTLTMTVYGDLDVSVLDELPRGRGRLVTAVRSTGKKPQAATFLLEQLAQGRQAYIVYPLIEDSDKLELGSAAEAFPEWQKRLGDDVRCGLLHGRLSADEKEAVMKRFRDGELQVLVATTVIEVGVDVGNASVMLIYNAERFGLAQLHQLRGRIGRGEHKSYCILMCPEGDADAARKLQILAETRDGFRIAEADLARRGPGNVLGTAQSGLPALRMIEYFGDIELASRARSLARDILDKDPDLSDPAHQALGELLRKSQGTLANVS